LGAKWYSPEGIGVNNPSRKAGLEVIEYILKVLDCSLEVIDYTLKVLDCSLEVIDYILKVLDFSLGVIEYGLEISELSLKAGENDYVRVKGWTKTVF
jgi:hypothetical protein